MEKTENFNDRGEKGWLLNCFFLYFSNHENYSIKNICVYSKSKIKTKVTNKQNLEYFKTINRRLFIHRFCNNSQMLLPSSWAIFIRALVFSVSPRANFFFVSVLVLFVSTNFLIHSYLVQTEIKITIIDISCKFYLRKLPEIYILHQISCSNNRPPKKTSPKMKRIAYSSSFTPCKN